MDSVIFFFLDYFWIMRVIAKSSPCTWGRPMLSLALLLDYSWIMRVVQQNSPPEAPKRCSKASHHHLEKRLPAMRAPRHVLLLDSSWITLGFRTWCGSKISWGWGLTLICPCNHHCLTAMQHQAQESAEALDIDAKAQHHQHKLKQRLKAWTESPGQ